MTTPPLHVPSLKELTALAAQAGDALRAAGVTCATAESCTGGLVGHLLTEIAGSSAYFMGGAIVYSNAAKAQVIGVEPALLEEHGAVSAPVAAQMAQGARRLYGVDMAVSITGIAGPGGGSADKPTGLTFLHLSLRPTGRRAGIEIGERHVWPADRSGNKRLSAQVALRLLLTHAAPQLA